MVLAEGTLAAYAARKDAAPLAEGLRMAGASTTWLEVPGVLVVTLADGCGECRLRFPRGDAHRAERNKWIDKITRAGGGWNPASHKSQAGLVAASDWRVGHEHGGEEAVVVAVAS